ncbi:uncharacterized protein [Narcine bancroftii]
MKQLLSKSVSNLRCGKAVIFSTFVEDVDECSHGLSMCDPESNCLNSFGFYSCQCVEGSEDGSGISCGKNVKSASEWLAHQGGDALNKCINLKALIEGNLSKSKAGIFNELFWWQFCYSTSGFWSYFHKEITSAQNSIQVNTLINQQVEDCSRDHVRECSDCIGYPHSCLIEDSLLQGVVHSTAIHDVAQSLVSDEMPSRGNSMHYGSLEELSTGLLKSFDYVESWMTKDSKLLSDWGSTCWGMVENLECSLLSHKIVLSLKTDVYTKTEQYVPFEPESSVAISNSGMRESEMVYSVSLGGMVSSLLTTSFNIPMWMKAESHNLYIPESGLQTSVYQTRESTEPLITPTHVDPSLVTNSRWVSGNEFWNYEMEWLKTWILSCKTLIEPEWKDIDATARQIETSFLDAQYTSDPFISHTPIWMTVVPKLQDSGNLLEVSTELELANVVYKNFQRLEKRLLQSIQNLIMDNLVSFYPPLEKILPRDAKRINASGFIFVYELHFGPNGENIQYFLQRQMNNLTNKLVGNLRNGQVHLVSVSVRDIDECKSRTAACGKEANCFNTIGSYFCQCKHGFDSHSVGQNPMCIELGSSFWSSFGLKEILIACALGALLLVSLALAFCFVMFKRLQKKCIRTRNPYLVDVSGRSSSSEESGSEESLFIVQRRSISYVSFRKFQPIPEEPSGQETCLNEISIK